MPRVVRMALLRSAPPKWESKKFRFSRAEAGLFRNGRDSRSCPILRRMGGTRTDRLAPQGAALERQARISRP